MSICKPAHMVCLYFSGMGLFAEDLGILDLYRPLNILVHGSVRIAVMFSNNRILV